MNRRIRKAIAAGAIALNFLTLGNIAWVRLDYSARMPRAPDPQSGRVQPIVANHSWVYVTPAEATKLRRANAIAMLGAFLAILGVYLAFGFRKVERDR
jgi:hypothetical protein